MQIDSGLKKIKLYGDKILREKCQNVKCKEEIKDIIPNMIASLYFYNGIGLAANQIGYNKRIIVWDTEWVSSNKKYSKSLNIFINPEITEESIEDEPREEACLSLPGITGIVYRPRLVKIKYLDPEFNIHESFFSGIEARIILHEIDHLDGKLFIDKVSKQEKELMLKKLVEIRRKSK